MWNFVKSRSEAPPPRVERGTEQKNCLFLLEVFFGGAYKSEIVKTIFLRGCPEPAEGRAAGRSNWIFSGIFDKIGKVGSRIFKQRAPNWTSRFLGSQNDRMLAAPAGAARKELGGKIKRRDEIPRHNFFGNEAVRYCEAMYENKFSFQFFAQNIPLRGIEAIFHSLAEHKPRQNIKL